MYVSMTHKSLKNVSEEIKKLKTFCSGWWGSYK